MTDIFKEYIPRWGHFCSSDSTWMTYSIYSFIEISRDSLTVPCKTVCFCSIRKHIWCCSFSFFFFVCLAVVLVVLKWKRINRFLFLSPAEAPIKSHLPSNSLKQTGYIILQLGFIWWFNFFFFFIKSCGMFTCILYLVTSERGPYKKSCVLLPCLASNKIQSVVIHSYGWDSGSPEAWQ